MIEVNKGVLVIGLSNTILFGGESTVELLMLNVASGQDFSLPLTEEQAEYLLEQVSVEDLLNVETEPQEEDESTYTKVPDANVSSIIKNSSTKRAELDEMLGNSRASGAGVDAWESTEKTPQL